MSKGADFLDSNVIDDKKVNFDAYIDAKETAKIKAAGEYRDQVVTLFLEGEEVTGQKLPWAKADGFRFRDSELSIWTGYNGHKKSMMQGFVLLGLLAQGSRACVASLEMPPRKTIWRMCKQWVGTGDPTRPYIDKYFDWLKSKLWLYDQVGTIDWRRMIGVARYSIMELGCNHFIIDSLMKCGIDEDDLNSQKRFVDELATLAKDTGAHIHLVAHSKKPADGKEGVAPTKYMASGSAHITNLADNVLVCWSQKDETKGYDQILYVDKQRNGEAEPNFVLNFDDSSLQFKGSKSTPRLGPDEWEKCKWL